ncbi:MAG: hypothetical protein LWX83_16865, partial [Anaerolineae bacterium]|nr:hypothetical protein [Anaerolineae bacterium]
IQGAIDIPLLYDNKFEDLSRQYSNLFQDLGLELITMRTNLMHFNRHLVPFNYFVNAPLLASAFLLSPLLTGVVLSGSYDYEHLIPDGVSPLAVRPLCTENLEVITSGYESNRFNKTLEMLDWPVAQQNLRVCLNLFNNQNQNNCSHCPKCLRTRIVLNLAGKLDQFVLFESPFGLKDFLEWGRWLEIGFDWEFKILDYCFTHRLDLLAPVIIAITIGYIRHFIKKILPEPVLKWIFKFTSPGDPYLLFIR